MGANEDLIQEFLLNITGQGPDYSSGRTEYANNVLKDFFSTMDNVNSPGDFDAKQSEINSLNSYFPEYRGQKKLMTNSLQEKQNAYNIYNKGVLGAKKLIEENKTWLNGSPEQVFSLVKEWTVDDVWETANKIRKIKSSLQFGDPTGAQHGQGQNFTQGIPGNKGFIDEFMRLDQMWQMILDDAVSSKKHTFKYNETTTADGNKIEKEAFIPLLTKDDIKNILLGDEESFAKTRKANSDFLVNSLNNNIKQINRLDSFNNSLVRRSVDNEGEETITYAVLDGDGFTSHGFRADINPIDKEVMDMAFSLVDANGQFKDINSGKQLVDFINSKILSLQNSNDALNIASLKWTNTPIIPLADQVYDYKNIDEKGFYTYNLGLINNKGEEVPDQVILQDLERKTESEIESNRNEGFNSLFGQ